MFAKKELSSSMKNTRYAVLKDNPWPQKQEKWPHARDLGKYTEYLFSPLTFKSLSESPHLVDLLFLASLASYAQNTATEMDDLLQRTNPQTPIVVDIGLGDGQALNELKKQMDVVTIGLGLHEIKPENVSAINLLCYSEVAHGLQAQRMFNALRGKVALVCEVFGASTYAGCTEDKPKSTPIDALIYAAFLLSPGGQARIILSGILEENEDLSPIGFAIHRQRLVELMQKWGFEIQIARTFINSSVVRGRYSVDFLITIKRPQTGFIIPHSLDEACKEAETYIGTSSLVPKANTLGEFGNGFGIRARTYTRPTESVQLRAVSPKQGIANRSFRFAEDQYPSYTFHFKTQEGMADFIYRFGEYYLNNRLGSDWTLSTKPDQTVCITYIKTCANRLEAKRESGREIERDFPGILSNAVSYANFHSTQTDSTTPDSSLASAWSLTGAF